MASYRFCRTDDVPLLVEAHERCFRVHFPDLPQLDVDGFKQLTREMDLWCSSCMVAVDAGEPVGVLLATKRETETLIWRVGTHPDYQRQGHALHLMTSLSAKLAILGPPRLLLEIPEALSGAQGFAEACGYQRGERLIDYLLDGPVAMPERGAELIGEVHAEELNAAGLLKPGPWAWSRTPRSILGARKRLTGLTIASPERHEAWVLFEDTADERRILTLGAADPEQGAAWLGLLLRAAAAGSPGRTRIPTLHPDEIEPQLLLSHGFRPAKATLTYAATPVPA